MNMMKEMEMEELMKVSGGNGVNIHTCDDDEEEEGAWKQRVRASGQSKRNREKAGFLGGCLIKETVLLNAVRPNKS